MNLSNIYPVHNYAIIELLPEIMAETESLILPNTIHYETDGGKVGAKAEPRKYENKGKLLRCTNPSIEAQVLEIVKAFEAKNPNLAYDIYVTVRDKAVIENLKIGNAVHDNIVIINVNDIRLIHIEEMSSTLPTIK